MNYTKGEWKVAMACYDNQLPAIHVYREECPYPIIGNGSGIVICKISNSDLEGGLANAHLIAAAPDMYEALREAEAILDLVAQGVTITSLQRTLPIVKKALAKAEGR